jgi:glycosyltransferase involved in cell wall biosynthesis
MKIAFIGSRGIPARYSGFETFYEQLSIRLAKLGHDVSVYNRSHFIKGINGYYNGVKIISLSSIQTKHLDTLSHTLISTFNSLFGHYDIIYYCIVGNSPIVWIPRVFGVKTLINVDGEDWAREKWSGFAKKYQLWCEKVACKTSNVVISDAHKIRERYLKRYKHRTVFVPYGANIVSEKEKESLKKWGLQPREYILYVGRFVPENSIDILIKAYKNLKTQKKLVLVGDAPYVSKYKSYLYSLAENDPDIIFTGYVFDKEYAQLSSHAYVYIQPSGVDGTRPALLDQMGFGNCVIVKNTPANLEVIGTYGLSFSWVNPVESLVHVLNKTLNDESLVIHLRNQVRERIKTYYNWDFIVAFYEDLFNRLLKKKVLISYDEYISDL